MSKTPSKQKDEKKSTPKRKKSFNKNNHESTEDDGDSRSHDTPTNKGKNHFHPRIENKEYLFSRFEKIVKKSVAEYKDDPLVDLLVISKDEFTVLEVPKVTKLNVVTTMDPVNENLLISEPILKTFLDIYNKQTFKSVIFKSNNQESKEENSTPITIPITRRSASNNIKNILPILKLDHTLSHDVPITAPRNVVTSEDKENDNVETQSQSEDKIDITPEDEEASKNISPPNTKIIMNKSGNKKPLIQTIKPHPPESIRRNDDIAKQTVISRTRGSAFSGLNTEQLAALNPYSDLEWKKDCKLREALIQSMFPLEGRRSNAKRTLVGEEGVVNQVEPEDPRIVRLHIKMKDINIGSSNTPIVVYFSAHCLRTKERLSEEYCLVWNAHLLPATESAETSAKQFILKLLDNLEDASLIVKCAILETDDPQANKEAKKKIKKEGIKTKPASPPIIDKTVHNEVTAYNNRRIFLCGGIRLVGKNKEQNRQIPLFTPKSGIDDEQIFDFIDGKRKAHDGYITITLENLEEDSLPTGRINSSFLPIKPFSQKDLEIDKKSNTSNIIPELELLEKDDCSVAYYYQNNLYIWPMKLLNWKHKGSPQISIKYLTKEDAEGLPIIYGSGSQDKFVIVAKTALVSTDSKPSLSDEFKIKLPLNINDKDHILVTISNVESKKGKQEVVGHAIFFINKLLNDEQEELPILTELTPDYLEIANQINSKDKKDNSRFTLCIKTKLSSTILTKDKPIYNFLYRKGPVESKYLTDLQQGKSNELVKFFFVLFQELLKVVCDKNLEIAKEAFVTLIHLIRTVNIEFKAKQGKLLREFVQYMVENFPKGSGLLQPYEGITRCYLACLKQNHPILNFFFEQWFLLMIVTRSMALYVHEEAKSLSRQDRFSKEFLSELVEMAKLLYKIDFLPRLPIFIRDIICLIDRGVALQLIDFYLSQMNEISRMNFLYALASHEFYIQLNLPLPLKFPKHVDWKEFSEYLMLRHFIAGKLIQHLGRNYSSNDQMTRKRDIEVFRTILSEAEVDERYKDRLRQTRIGCIYFPFLLMMIEDISPIKNMPSVEKIDWLGCFIYLLRCISNNAFESWIKLETKKRQLALFFLLKESLTTFETSPPQFLNQVAITVIEAISSFIQTHHKDINEETIDNFSIYKYIIYSIRFTCNIPSNEIVELVLGIAHQLIDLCPKVLFPDVYDADVELNDYLETLIIEFVKLCNSEHRGVRHRACAILYKLLRTNYRISGSISKIRMRTSIALSKIMGSQAGSFSFLSDSLSNIKNISIQGDESEDYKNQVIKMIDHMGSLLQQNELISHNSKDPDMLAAIYHKIANGFSHSPKLRITWLNNLHDAHVKAGNKCEAGQCKMSVAALLSLDLKKAGHLKRVPPYFEKLFDTIGPNLKTFFSENNNKEQEFGKVENWTVAQLIETLEEAVKLFEESTLYELCIELYIIISVILKIDNKKCPKLISILESHKTLLISMTDPDKAIDRIDPVYFRVGFYGKKWDEELRGKQFIYKRDAKYSLPVMIKHMEEIFGQKYGAENVVVLSGNKKIEDLTFTDDKYYIQLAGVVPYVSPDEANTKVTVFHQNFNVDKFLFATAFADEGKSITDDLATQKKKKTIFTTKRPYPYVENRMEVINVEEIILSPIENAIELIKTQTAKVHYQLDMVPIRVKPLQQTLQGSVVPMVNPGPIKVCEIFLSPQSIKQTLYKEKDVLVLMDAMDAFLKKCAFAVKMNSYLGDENVKFSEMIEKSFGELEKTVKNAIEGAKKALESMKAK